MHKNIRSAKQLHGEFLRRIEIAGRTRTEYLAKHGQVCDELLPYLIGTLRADFPELATALANAAGMGHLNEPHEATTK
ncbi:hypothetical protein [Burkholderia cenocepacia]|uniref:hypothetical protein n=1 Tax=Burkholderia cenocepacia TaxID=95486 RepID=UPI001CF18D0F|nr:hypothetical protein [Burkholderia cenocepacia]MCA8082735.1 hypothetical protein [Burkholderia cenocepacia]